MGNHLVGKMFVSGIAHLTDEEIDNLTQEKALAILDKIGKEVIASTSLDAEFDDHLDPNQRLGRVVIKAFLPEKYEEWKNEPDVNEEMDEEYYDKIEKPFRARFGFW
jgi:hypothetical protein